MAMAETTKDRLVTSIFRNVRGRVFTFARQADGSWKAQQLPFPDNLTTGVRDGDSHGDQALVSVAGFLTPSSVWLADGT